MTLLFHPIIALVVALSLLDIRYGHAFSTSISQHHSRSRQYSKRDFLTKYPAGTSTPTAARPSTPRTTTHYDHRRLLPNAPWQLYSSKEEEIAKLEEQLRRLRDESTSEPQQEQQEQTLNDASTTVSTSSGEYVGRGPAKRPVAPREEMMSEAWKASEAESSGNGSSMITLAAALAVVLFLGDINPVRLSDQ